MQKLNIFLNNYQGPENKLTYNFLALIELLNSKEFCEYLLGVKLEHKPIIDIQPQFYGVRSKPDGKLMVKDHEGEIISVYFENKTHRLRLLKSQLLEHLKLCSIRDILLVITTKYADIKIIEEIEDRRIRFFTWEQIAGYIMRSVNHDIAKQFIQYGEICGEFEDLADLSKEDIKLYNELIKLKFTSRINRIIREFKDNLNIEKFGFQKPWLETFGPRWGRNAVDINCDRDDIKCTYNQWWAVGHYYDTKDHGIPFKCHTTEIVFFFEINPIYKDLLRKDKDFRIVTCELENMGFESNLDDQLTKNRWRLIVYRKPITDFEGLNVTQLISFTDEVFSKLLSTTAIKHNYFSEFM